MAVTGLEEGKKNKRSETDGNTRAPGAGSKRFGRTESGKTGVVRFKAAWGTISEPGKDGFETLRQLVNEALLERGNAVSDALIRKAAEGSSSAAHTLILLLNAPKEKKAEKRTRQGPSLAGIWAAEPRWEESSEETAEVGAGGREPEG